MLPEAPYVGILAALAIGDQQAISAEQWRLFRQTGVTHLMSISGLHVTMVAALFRLIGGLWRRSERLMLWLPAPKAAIAAGWLAACGYLAARRFRGADAADVVHAERRRAGAVVGAQPGRQSQPPCWRCCWYCCSIPGRCSPGFWLSFAAVGLLFFNGSARLGVERGWRAAIARWGATQWAVTIGTLPLLLLLFQQFSLVSPLANALAIPVVSFLIAPLALLFTRSSWPPLLYVDHWLLAALMGFLDWLGRGPCG